MNEGYKTFTDDFIARLAEFTAIGVVGIGESTVRRNPYNEVVLRFDKSAIAFFAVQQFLLNFFLLL